MEYKWEVAIFITIMHLLIFPFFYFGIVYNIKPALNTGIAALIVFWMLYGWILILAAKS